MAAEHVAPYGSWRSPITADLIASGAIGLGSPTVHGDDVYWTELRPAEGGRNVVVHRSPDGQIRDVTPPPFSARTRVHEYGGGSYLVADGVVYFSNFADQRLYRALPDGRIEALTPEAEVRYADFVLDPRHGRLIAVREDRRERGHEPVNTLVSLPLTGGDTGTILVSGNDFYSSPRVGSDGSRLAWLTWSHPNMPWDGNELWVGELRADGSVGRAERVAGGASESIFQPEWSPDGVLHFVSDRSGWWNLYRWRHRHVEALWEKDAEFGAPQWTFGMSTYAFESAERILCAYCEGGTWHLASLNTQTGRSEPIETPYTSISGVRAYGRTVFVAGSPAEPLSIVELDLATKGTQILRRSVAFDLDEAFISRPRAITFPTEGGLQAHGFFYPPRNPAYRGPPGELPPLLVMSHGGPTSTASTALRLGIQYWTSRGIAALDVDYRGSTGYGREYREALYGQWGVADVDDCVNGARYLVDQGEVDPNRLAITGGSAGGYTTLCALAFRQVFHAGSSHYGVSDLEALAQETHKFESRYLDRLVGPYPERKDLYRERSPIHFPEGLSRPVLFLQGLDDPIVPPNQAERMVAALRAKGVPVAYLAFEGEQHGFRRVETIRRALEAELYFYSRIFGFELVDPVPPVDIENL